ncbi:MAG TPA: hypothetical protein VHQ65_16740 [Thermoanaerobaculia bacterium]|nr:hypothetical protein [Thermoanaerobaculia bacterium]
MSPAALSEPPAGGAAAAPRPLVRAPEPAFFWIRYAPREWPAPPEPWTDLARGALGRPGAGGPEAALADPSAVPCDDVLWLPPVPAGLAAERDRLARRHLEGGTPVLAQVAPGDAAPPEGAVALYDLLAPLLAGDLDRLAEVPAGAATAWPLLPGLTDEDGLVRRGCARLAAAGVAVVQPLTPELGPADRRRLSEAAAGDAFERLFHGPDPDERGFARAATAAGLAIVLPRPLPRPPLAGAANRRLAGWLFLAGDLWLRLGRTPSRGQALFTAGRWIDETGYAVEALAREGNLAVVAAFDDDSRRLVEEAVAAGRPPALLDELLREYTGREAIDEEES